MQNYAVFVPHFHWDREWYEPFQVFRHRLVEALDVVLATAENERSFKFTVDGQTAAILDYLEIRPERREQVRELAESGRLALGPWYILLDEFLCSGETIVRNLRFGWADATALGRAMPLGYLPDMFGHVAQMPQILRRAGFEHAALWRGVPGTVAGHAFRWEAPDGSAVRTEFLFDGYDNGLDVILVPAVIDRALADYTRMTADRWGTDPVLAMVGTDHAAPDPRLGAWLREAERPGRGIQIATIEEYVTAHARDEVTETVRGELRGHVRGNILPGGPVGARGAQARDGRRRTDRRPRRAFPRHLERRRPGRRGAVPRPRLAQDRRVVRARLGRRLGDGRDLGPGRRPAGRGRARRPRGARRGPRPPRRDRARGRVRGRQPAAVRPDRRRRDRRGALRRQLRGADRRRRAAARPAGRRRTDRARRRDACRPASSTGCCAASTGASCSAS